jgi:hypothetical protein
MHTWNVRDARSCFAEVMRRALAGDPQRVSGDRPGSVVVLSEMEYESLLGQKSAGPEVEREHVRRPGLVEFMRNSPLAQAVSDGELPEDLFDQIRKEMWGQMPRAEPVKEGFRSGQEHDAAD